MPEIIRSWKLDSSLAKEWQKAADTWRMPYWGPSLDDDELPHALLFATVKIYLPTGASEQDHPNPFWAFGNPERNPNNRKYLSIAEILQSEEFWNTMKGTSDPSVERPPLRYYKRQRPQGHDQDDVQGPQETLSDGGNSSNVPIASFDPLSLLHQW